MKTRALALGATVIALGAPIGLAACGGSSSSSTEAANPNAAEVSPPGDIPDNQVFVDYSPPGAGYSVKVPEGWSRSSTGGAVTFTDKLNSIRLESRDREQGADGGRRQGGAAEARRDGQGLHARRRLRSSSAAPAPPCSITYTGDGPPDPVTGKTVTDAFERYEFFHNGKLAIADAQRPRRAPTTSTPG